ncbi:hypothetical protein JX266_012850 [Neoarthrinium moseri]|nr:hypothetical protein JX266_012850 [Neoarthrinium moseri]
MFSTPSITNIDSSQAVQLDTAAMVPDYRSEITTSENEDNLSLLYKLVVLEKAMTKFYDSVMKRSDSQTSPQGESILSDEHCFRFSMNKLAQACDSERGGKTVSAITALQGVDGTVFVLASNQRDADELKTTTIFLERLLGLIGENPNNLKKKALAKLVLYQILEFCIKRVDLYLKYLGISLDECIACCGMGADTELKEELEKLKGLAVFPRDIVSNINARQKCFSDCSTLMNAILAMKNTTLEKDLKKRAIGDSFSNPEPWHELQHYCGRLLSYRQAAETLVTAQERWPQLFKSFKVFAIPSSTRMPRPIRNTSSQPITATQIIHNMGLGKELEDDCIRKIQLLPHLGLNTTLQDIVANPRFRPIVHAEMLIHDCLQKLPIDPEQLYWNNWKYIGSSKPTCRLCSYYFEAQDVTVRETHNNIYQCWRLPELPETADQTVVDMQRRLLTHLTERMQEDVKRLIFEKQRAGRRHDSATYSGTIGVARDFISATSSDTGLPSTRNEDLMTDKVGAHTTSWQDKHDDWIVTGDKSDISDEDYSDP